MTTKRLTAEDVTEIREQHVARQLSAAVDIEVLIHEADRLRESRDRLLDACKCAKAQFKKGTPKKALPDLRAAIAEAEEETR